MIVKIVWQEIGQEKAKVGKGNLLSEDENFISIGLEDGASITISRKYIISIRRYESGTD